MICFKPSSFFFLEPTCLIIFLSPNLLPAVSYLCVRTLTLLDTNLSKMSSHFISELLDILSMTSPILSDNSSSLFLLLESIDLFFSNWLSIIFLTSLAISSFVLSVDSSSSFPCPSNISESLSIPSSSYAKSPPRRTFCEPVPGFPPELF